MELFRSPARISFVGFSRQSRRNDKVRGHSATLEMIHPIRYYPVNLNDTLALVPTEGSPGMKWPLGRRCALFLLAALVLVKPTSAQFFDGFDALKLEPENGWFFKAGDGTATMDFRHGGLGYASIFVDGTTDKRGIWWALVERKVSEKMDLSLLKKPGHEFRIEARIRSSHAPRRVNLQILS